MIECISVLLILLSWSDFNLWCIQVMKQSKWKLLFFFLFLRWNFKWKILKICVFSLGAWRDRAVIQKVILRWRSFWGSFWPSVLAVLLFSWMSVFRDVHHVLKDLEIRSFRIYSFRTLAMQWVSVSFSWNCLQITWCRSIVSLIRRLHSQGSDFSWFAMNVTVLASIMS